MIWHQPKLLLSGYDNVYEGVSFKLKRIQLKPGANLSKQMHHHRSIHWDVVLRTDETKMLIKYLD